MAPTLSGLARPERSAGRDRALGALLAFVAGASNAGGFLAIGRYTSHMTGIVSSMADDLVLGHAGLATIALAALLCFVSGAMTTTIWVNWGRRHDCRSLFAVPLLLEAVLLLLFGAAGVLLAPLDAGQIVAVTLLLCYLMGLQNALITKISHAEIRTTHVTGLVTDIGIELGRLVYINRGASGHRVLADRERLRVHLLLLGAFVAGSLLGALAFKVAGFAAALPLALLLAWTAWRPVLEDLSARRGHRRYPAG